MASNREEKANLKRLVEKIRKLWPELNMKESTFENLTQEFVFRFYSVFHQSFTNSISEIESTFSNEESEPDHWNIVNPNENLSDAIILAFKMRDLSQMFGVIDFYLTDMIEPQKKRTIVFFSLFTDVYNFLLTDSQLREDLQNATHKKNSLKEIKEKIRIISEEHSEIAQKCGVNRMKVQKFTAEIEKISPEYQKVLKLMEEKKPFMRNLTEKSEEIKQTLKKQIADLDELKKEEEILKSKKSELIPESEVEAMKNKIIQVQEQLSQLDKSKKDMVDGLVSQEKRSLDAKNLYQDLKFKFVENVNELQNDVNAFNKITEEIEKTREEMHTNDVIIQKLRKHNSELLKDKFQLNSFLEKFMQNQKQEIENLDDEIENALDTIKNDDIESAELTKIIQTLELKIKDERNNILELDQAAIKRLTHLFNYKKKSCDDFNNIIHTLNK